jgi:N-acylglucosamine 2-epimerase
MLTTITTPPGLVSDSSTRAEWEALYRHTLLENVIPFWLKHGLDRVHGGYYTALDRDGTLIDTDKSIWFQGRGAWMFATLYNTVERKSEWLDAAVSGIDFLRRHGMNEKGKYYFSVTGDGKPLRMRRYVYSESFAAVANAALARATNDERAAYDAIAAMTTFLRYSFEPGHITSKTEAATRPMRGIGPLMIGLVSAQELRLNMGDIQIHGRRCSEWIDWFIAEIAHWFVKPDRQVVMETVGLHGEILDHMDGRLLNPGHAIEAAWFIMHEGKHRRHQQYIQLGLNMLDWMWNRGWDQEYGGLFYFRDLEGRPVQEYWHDMKFWWPHCEAIIATLLAWDLTGNERYARMHRQVHDWSYRHFADPEYGEWFGWVHRDGRLSSPLKGSLWKGPFHLPRMLWYCSNLLEPRAA